MYGGIYASCCVPPVTCSLADVQHVTSLTISSLSTSSLQLTPAADGGGGAAMSASGLNQPYMYISSGNR